MAGHERRVYSDEEKASGLALLASHGGDVSKAARAAGVPRRTLQRWRDETPEVVAQIAQDKKAALAALFEAEVEAALGAAGAKRGEASYRDLITGAAIAADKRQLLLDEPTENVKQAGRVEVVVRREDRPIRASQ